MLISAGCASATKRSGPETTEPKPIGELVESTRVPEATGKFLADLDARIRAWTTLALSAQSLEDRRKASLLEQNLMYVTVNRVDELIEQLETGPEQNQIVAAAGLGFTRDPRAQSPLIAALDSKSNAVVANALLGLAILGRADTPLAKVCVHLSASTDSWVRSNAAWCAANLVQTGQRDGCILDAARRGLADQEPAVRSQCALVLASLVDAASLSDLAERLYDPVLLVRSACARAIAYIGVESPPDKGTAARALVQAYEKAPEKEREPLLRAMVELAGTATYGKEPQEWIEWSQRLP
ncbi:MAG: HEAT repeat domain-containing protein [Planctomycetota bacterium]